MDQHAAKSRRGYWWPTGPVARRGGREQEISVAAPMASRVSTGHSVARPTWRRLRVGREVHTRSTIRRALKIGATNFSRRLGDLSLDFYALPEDLDKATRQFAQAKPMLQVFERYFGEYPFEKDGYKLIQVPYAGMEHQSAVAYGNHFANGYFVSPDWTGVGISPRFDFIIIHESAHEWFGNSVTAADVSDMWIHEGWATYMECLFVEYMYGHADYLTYTNAQAEGAEHHRSSTTRSHREPTQDMYFKGALSFPRSAASLLRRVEELLMTSPALKVPHDPDRGRGAVLHQQTGRTLRPLTSTSATLRCRRSNEVDERRAVAFDGGRREGPLRCGAWERPSRADRSADNE